MKRAVCFQSRNCINKAKIPAVLLVHRSEQCRNRTAWHLLRSFSLLAPGGGHDKEEEEEEKTLGVADDEWLSNPRIS